VVELVAAQARLTPDGVAAESDGVCLSYQGLCTGADRLAWRLRAMGVNVGSLVGPCLEPGPELVLAVLGAMGIEIPLGAVFDGRTIKGQAISLLSAFAEEQQEEVFSVRDELDKAQG
jgi:non-ribosomal peptide synthetase component F